MTEASFDWMPIVLSSLAGLSTCVGASVAFCAQQHLGPASMAFSLGLAGSVMVTVSLCSLLPESFSSDGDWLSIDSPLFLERCLFVAAGSGLYAVLSKCAFPEPDAILGLDKETPAVEDEERLVPASPRRALSNDRIRIRNASKVVEESRPIAVMDTESSPEPTAKDRHGRYHDETTVEARRAWRVAMLLFVSLAVHNFPEGFAVAASTISSPKLGVTTALAIAFHNIPEGIAIAVPCLAARPDSPWLAFGLASLSGLAEPLGAVVALVVLQGVDRHAESSLNTENVLAFVAGIMVAVAVAELFPEAWRNAADRKWPLVVGVVAGAVIMIASDAILEA